VVLRLLLDQHFSLDLVRALHRLQPDVSVADLFHWEDGAYYGMEDEVLLTAAYRAQLTLVTRDVSTIPHILLQWSSVGRSHGGVIFVPRRFPQGNVGTIARALAVLYDNEGQHDWTDTVRYLEAPA
jgi:hypothetical protein